MLSKLRAFLKTLPTLLLAFAMAVAIWIIAVTANDPIEARDYPSAIPLEVTGLDPHLLITSNLPSSLQLKLSAPHSVWTDLQTRTQPIHVLIDLSGLGAGVHTVPIQVQVAVKPVRVMPFSPSQVEVTLEELVSQEFLVRVNSTGTPALGFKVDAPILNPARVILSGPKSLMQTVASVQINLPLEGARENILATVTPVAMDAKEQIVKGVSFSPGQVQISANVIPLSGYRNVAVKVVWQGVPANGYQLTNITTTPPAVTVFSQDPRLVDNLPGYLETVPLDLSNVKDSFNTLVNLNIPMGITVLNQNSVEISVGVQPIEGNITLNNMPVTFTGLGAGLSATISPSTVTIILSGPLATLNTISVKDVSVSLDLTGLSTGSYQKTPMVTVANPNVTLVSIVPESLGVLINPGVTPTP